MNRESRVNGDRNPLNKKQEKAEGEEQVPMEIDTESIVCKSLLYITMMLNQLFGCSDR